LRVRPRVAVAMESEMPCAWPGVVKSVVSISIRLRSQILTPCRCAAARWPLRTEFSKQDISIPERTFFKGGKRQGRSCVRPCRMAHSSELGSYAQAEAAPVDVMPHRLHATYVVFRTLTAGVVDQVGLLVQQVGDGQEELGLD